MEWSICTSFLFLASAGSEWKWSFWFATICSSIFSTFMIAVNWPNWKEFVTVSIELSYDASMKRRSWFCSLNATWTKSRAVFPRSFLHQILKLASQFDWGGRFCLFIIRPNFLILSYSRANFLHSDSDWIQICIHGSWHYNMAVTHCQWSGVQARGATSEMSPLSQTAESN